MTKMTKRHSPDKPINDKRSCLLYTPNSKSHKKYGCVFIKQILRKMQISAILSDYDGTLCPTSSIRNRNGDSLSKCNNSSNKIPEELEKGLFKISKRIPVCIVSSKDFIFLHEITGRFAKVLSCILGIETIIHEEHNVMADHNDLDCIIMRSLTLTPGNEVLTKNSAILKSMIGKVSKHWKDIIIEQKFTSERTLVGLTFDYRHLQNWKSFKESLEPSLKALLQHQIDKYMSSSFTSNQRPFIQTYSSHPFLDVYAVECNKGSAFDHVLSQMSKLRNYGYRSNYKERNVMYLGDSENDNPAFGKSDISIGVSSDKRLNPKLDCQYNIEFKHLTVFLRRLLDNDLIFSENLIMF
jgi:HAD superfamily hydrolase (TIGR01484 family)